MIGKESPLTVPRILWLLQMFMEKHTDATQRPEDPFGADGYVT